MKRLLVHVAVVTLALAGLVEPALAKGAKEAVFSAPKEKVFAAALEVVASEWRIDSADKESGTISFRSGMSARSWKGQDLALLIVETDGKTKVLVNAEKRGYALTSFGEGGKLSKKAIHLIGKKLHEDGLIPESEIPKK